MFVYACEFFGGQCVFVCVWVCRSSEPDMSSPQFIFCGILGFETIAELWR